MNIYTEEERKTLTNIAYDIECLKTVANKLGDTYRSVYMSKALNDAMDCTCILDDLSNALKSINNAIDGMHDVDKRVRNK